MPIRFVQIGSVSRVGITPQSAVLRSSAVELMGSDIGSIPLDGYVHAIGGLLRATVPGGRFSNSNRCRSPVGSCAGVVAQRQQAARGIHNRSLFVLICRRTLWVIYLVSLLRCGHQSDAHGPVMRRVQLACRSRCGASRSRLASNEQMRAIVDAGGRSLSQFALWAQF